MSKLKFDLAQEGLRCILRPHQIEIMRHFWDTQTPIDSRTVHDHLLSVEVEGAKSRASIINFLNYMVDEGFLDFENKTTKGGIKRVYRLNGQSSTEDVFKAQIVARFTQSLREFGEQEEAEG